jgi:hypothetical protein
MTIRRRRLWLSIIAGLVLVGGVWSWASSLAAKELWVSQARGVNVGMTLEETTARIGRPPKILFDGKTRKIVRWKAVDGNVFATFQDNKILLLRIEDTGFFCTQLLRLFNEASRKVCQNGLFCAAGRLFVQNWARLLPS